MSDRVYWVPDLPADGKLPADAVELTGFIADRPPEPDYFVLRVAPALVDALPSAIDGLWLDRSQLPAISRGELAGMLSLGYGYAKAVPTGRFEVREYDGAVAEVFEFVPDDGGG